MEKPIAIGMCLSPERVPDLAPGYDFIELAVSSNLIPLEEDTVYDPRRPGLASLLPPIRAFNLFVPAQVNWLDQT